MDTELKMIRCSKNLTQVELANKAGVSEVAYQLYEYNKRTPNVRTAIRIADALGIQDLRTLWGGNLTR